MPTNHTADPANPRPSIHEVRQHPELVERDAQAMLAWLARNPLQTITGPALIYWIRAQSPPWTNGYTRHVRARVAEVMRARTVTDAEATRARLIQLCDALVPHCVRYRTGTGPDGTGTMFLRSPETGELLHEIDHGAVQGYPKLVASITGAEAPVKHAVGVASLESLIAATVATGRAVTAQVVEQVDANDGL